MDHIVPLSLDGRDVLSNMTTLCANCHRMVHWLSAGDRSIDAHAYGLGKSGAHKRRLLALARRIRRRRLRIVGRDLKLTAAVSLETAMKAVVQRNGLDASEAALMLLPLEVLGFAMY
jgi:HNH endonuclease